MAQTYTENCFVSTNNPLTDAQNMENNFAAARSSFSGASAPANPVEGQLWRDTNKKLLKLRGVSAWFGLMHGDVNQKMYVYRNDTIEGWVIDTAITDRVLAFKGGLTYTAGGALAGSWTLPSHTHGVNDHVHQWYAATLRTGGDDHTFDASGNAVDLVMTTDTLQSGDPTKEFIRVESVSGGGGGYSTLLSGYTSKTGGSTASGGNLATYRPAAAVGTLQRMDI